VDAPEHIAKKNLAEGGKDCPDSLAYTKFTGAFIFICIKYGGEVKLDQTDQV
jgi:hypothetical protein